MVRTGVGGAIGVEQVEAGATNKRPSGQGQAPTPKNHLVHSAHGTGLTGRSGLLQTQESHVGAGGGGEREWP